jgi:3-hydroxybutyryl-CoA dehydratase
VTAPDDLRAGDAFRHARACDRLRPVYYAAASGDFNPLHLDVEVARRAGLPSTILQGMCTFAWLAEACTAYLGDPGRLRRIAARFSRPVAPGDAVTFEGRCAAREGDRLALEVAVRNQRGEPVLTAAVAEASLAPVAPRAAEAAPAPAAGDSRSDPRSGRRYGPYRYEVGVEKLREFALAVAGGVPAQSFGAVAPDPPPHPLFVDEEAGRRSAYGSIVAPPTFAAALAIRPCAAAFLDPANGVDVLHLLHGDEDLALHGVVRPGDVLETSGAIVRVEPKRSFDVFHLHCRTVNQRGEAVIDAASAWVARRHAPAD